jgi:hypothetical protein
VVSKANTAFMPGGKLAASSATRALTAAPQARMGHHKDKRG